MSADVKGGHTRGAERPSGGMHPNWPSQADFQRLSRAFNAVANLRDAQDVRINEWLKGMLAAKAEGPSS